MYRDDLFLPQVRIDKAINRVSLIDNLGRLISDGCPLIALCAPAGYGKSTLLAQLCLRQEQAGAKVMWLNCLPVHKKIEYLLADFTAALQAKLPQVSATDSPSATLTASWFDGKQPVLLCFDNFEEAISNETEEWFEHWVRHLPKQVCCLLGSRESPGHFLTRLELSGHACTVLADQLRMKTSEAQALLLGVISESELPSVIDYANGWPIALHLIKTKALIQNDRLFSAKTLMQMPRQQIFEYLAEEVITSIKPELLVFLEEISVLDRIESRVIDGVFEIHDSKGKLLEFKNLSPILLLDEQAWTLDIHPLLKDFLRTRVESFKPERVTKIRKAAALYFQKQGHWELAIDHALLAGQINTAVSFLEQAGAIRLIAINGTALCQSVLQKFPAHTVNKRRRLRIMRLALEILEKNTQGAHEEFQRIEKLAAEHQSDEDDAIDRMLLKSIFLVHQSEKNVRLEVWKTLTEIRRNLNDSTISDLRINGILLPIEIYFCHRLGLSALACSKTIEFEEWIRTQKSNSNLPWVQIYKARNEMASGHIDEAEKILNSLLNTEYKHFSHPNQPIKQLAQSLLINIITSQGKLEQAQAMIETFSTAPAVRMLDVLAAIYVNGARIEYHLGVRQRALQLLESAYELSDEESLPALRLLSASVQCELFARSGELELAESIMKRHALHQYWELGCQGKTLPWVLLDALFKALYWFYVAAKNIDKAMECARMFVALSQKAGMTISEVESSLMLNAIDKTNKKPKQLVADINRCMSHNLGYVFISLGPLIYVRIQQILKTKDHSFSIHQIEKFNLYMKHWVGQNSDEEQQHGLLTPREINVLRALCLEPQTKWAAKKLGISAETVKHHLKNIFRKLDVHTREQALKEAESRGFLA